MVNEIGNEMDCRCRQNMIRPITEKQCRNNCKYWEYNDKKKKYDCKLGYRNIKKKKE